MSETDFGAMMLPIAKHPDIWGTPNKALSNDTVIRWGGQGSKSVDVEKGTWFDHEQGHGGGAIALVMEVLHKDKAGALAWLSTASFIEARERTSAPQLRQEGREPVRAPEVPPEEESQPAFDVDEEQGTLTPVKGYRYTDGDGNVLYEVIRYQFNLADGSWKLGKNGNPKKTFKQRRPDGRGGYIPGLGDVKTTIYRRQQVEIAVAEGRTIWMPEGEKDVETLEAWGMTATTNSGGAGNWRDEFAAFFRGADVVILGDDDEPGRARVETIAKSLKGIAKRIRVVTDWGGFKDVTDWRDKGDGTAYKLGEILNMAPDWRPRPPTSRFGAVGLDQLHLPSLRHDFLVDGFLDRRGVAMMPGSSGSGKTFLVLEIGMCIATGQDFWNMPVKQGLVIYQAGEGKEGVTKRLDGWMLDRGIEPSGDLPFRMLPKKINLFVDDRDTDDLIAECRAWSEYYGQPVRLVVIDTFNKAITGANENAGQDMSRVLSRLERISETLDCAVLVPMHKSKQGDMRGHTSLTGDVSNVINVTKLEITDQNGRAIRTASLDKNKDGEGGRPMRFVLRQVVTDIEDGKPVTTCVVDKPNGDDEALTREGKLSAPQTILLNTLRHCLDTDGEQAPAGFRVTPHLNRVVKHSLFLQRLRARWPFTAPEHEIEKRNKEFERAYADAGKRLVASGYIDRDNDLGLIWWTGKSDKPRREVKAQPPVPPEVKAAFSSEVPF